MKLNNVMISSTALRTTVLQFYPSPLMHQWNPPGNFLDFSQFVNFNGLNPTNTFKPTNTPANQRFTVNNNTNVKR